MSFACKGFKAQAMLHAYKTSVFDCPRADSTIQTINASLLFSGKN